MLPLHPDDWMGDVENAIAAALKREGKEPPPLPRIASVEAAAVAATGDSGLDETGERRKGKKRKRREGSDRYLRRVSGFSRVLWSN